VMAVMAVLQRSGFGRTSLPGDAEPWVYFIMYQWNGVGWTKWYEGWQEGYPPIGVSPPFSFDYFYDETLGVWDTRKNY
jgi:hypothetical protein